MKTALVAGAGLQSNFSSALLRALGQAGFAVHAIARTPETANALQKKCGGATRVHVVDLLAADDLKEMVAKTEAEGPLELVVHNAARLVVGDFETTSLTAFEEAWRANVGTAINLAHAVLPLMASRQKGTLIVGGATASIRGGAKFSAFASAKFALRGLAQSLARAYGPRGVHVAHVILDGVLWGDRAQHKFSMAEEDCLDPAAVAQSYLHIFNQAPRAWSHELDLRPAHESF